LNFMKTPWRTALVTSDETSIRIRGFEIGELMENASFTHVIWLLHTGRMPSEAEVRLLNAILIASADHGAGAPSCAAARLVASGNRQSMSAAVAAGILAIGDEHGGAGSVCMRLIAESLERMRNEGLSLTEMVARVVAEARAAKRRVPGFGHRVHTVDPRVGVLFRMARDAGVDTRGADFMLALEREIAEKIKPLPMTVDGALAAVLHDLGFPPSAGKFMFIAGRAAGLTAEVAEEYAREKPMRIRIPVEYDGDPPREMSKEPA
jgi:citrate synthase